MRKLAANISMLFTELNFLDRFHAAAQSGFRGVEYIGPYDFPAKDIASRLQDNNLSQVLFNLPVGDWAKGERGIACLPGRKNEFRDGVSQAVEYAHILGCKQVNCLAGIVPPGEERSAEDAFVENLDYAASVLEREGIQLLIEAINTNDVPGFLVHSSRQVRDILSAVNSSNVGFQYDVYHMQVMEGNLARTIEDNLSVIKHIQIADNPGRHEPGSGEIDYRFLFKFLDALNYQGWIGCEYIPATTTKAGLDWLITHG